MTAHPRTGGLYAKSAFAEILKCLKFVQAEDVTQANFDAKATANKLRINLGDMNLQAARETISKIILVSEEEMHYSLASFIQLNRFIGHFNSQEIKSEDYRRFVFFPMNDVGQSNRIMEFLAAREMLTETEASDIVIGHGLCKYFS